jgi:hypothetical protein
MNKHWKVDRKHKIINAYELPEVKKLIKPSIDEQVQYTDIALNSRVLIVGGSGTGKTNLIINYMIESSKPKKGTFYEVILVYKTDEVLYQMLKNKFKDKLITYKDIKDVPEPESWEDMMTKDPEDRLERLIIFDDFVADKDRKTIDKLKKYCEFGRKKGLTQFYLTQSYYETNSFMRLQMNYILLLNLPNFRNLKMIISGFGLNIDVKDLLDMINYATEDKFDFFKLNLNASCPKNKKYSVGFLDFFEFDE